MKYLYLIIFITIVTGVGAVFAQPTLEKNSICQNGSASARRMEYSESYTIKRQLMAEIGATNPRLYQLDHIIPLELGGSNDRSNLALEPIAQAHIKDKMENYYHELYCQGGIELHKAQQIVVSYY